MIDQLGGCVSLEFVMEFEGLELVLEFVIQTEMEKHLE